MAIKQNNALNKFKKQAELKSDALVEDFSDIKEGAKITFTYSAENVIEYEQRKKDAQKELMKTIKSELKKKGIKGQNLDQKAIIDIAIDKLGEDAMDDKFNINQIAFIEQWIESFNVVTSEEIRKYFESIYEIETDKNGKTYNVPENKYYEFLFYLKQTYEEFLEKLSISNIVVSEEDDDINTP